MPSAKRVLRGPTDPLRNVMYGIRIKPLAPRWILRPLYLYKRLNFT